METRRANRWDASPLAESEIHRNSAVTGRRVRHDAWLPLQFVRMFRAELRKNLHPCIHFPFIFFVIRKTLSRVWIDRAQIRHGLSQRLAMRGRVLDHVLVIRHLW